METLRELRIRSGLTQHQAAQKFNEISSGAVSSDRRKVIAAESDGTDDFLLLECMAATYGVAFDMVAAANRELLAAHGIIVQK